MRVQLIWNISLDRLGKIVKNVVCQFSVVFSLRVDLLRSTKNIVIIQLIFFRANIIMCIIRCIYVLYIFILILGISKRLNSFFFLRGMQPT